MVILLLAGSGCTSERAYDSGQAYQRNECNKILDNNEHERCLNKINTSYDDYKHQTEEIKQ
ncbi:MAG: hypothetical protein HY080_17625 [Gammaproteobacteria bacterium]|nr:hypothetical protein [Gammaproteobacteria bacterium]